MSDAPTPGDRRDPALEAPSGGEAASAEAPRLTSLAHGGGCGCKIAPGILSDLLKSQPLSLAPAELLVGFETSDDAAVWRLNADQALVATTDFFTPIVDDPRDFGRIAATNALSDVYAMGARPFLALAVVAMPVGRLPSETVSAILAGGAEVCRAAGVALAGGHTIDSVEPIYGLVALGLARPDRILRNAGACPGDRLVLGKPLGVGVYSAALKRGALGADAYGAMIAATTALNTPGPDLAGLPGVHALTDVTGFGLAGHALEMARGSGVRLRIDWTRVPLLPDARRLAADGFVTGASDRNFSACAARMRLPAAFSGVERALLADPQTSGGLLCAAAPEAVEQVLSLFRGLGFPAAAVIGEVLPPDDAPDGAALLVEA